MEVAKTCAYEAKEEVAGVQRQVSLCASKQAVETFRNERKAAHEKTLEQIDALNQRVNALDAQRGELTPRMEHCERGLGKLETK
eukprot:810649-Prymnesium_polylepis.1